MENAMKRFYMKPKFGRSIRVEIPRHLTPNGQHVLDCRDLARSVE